MARSLLDRSAFGRLAVMGLHDLCRNLHRHEVEFKPLSRSNLVVSLASRMWRRIA